MTRVEDVVLLQAAVLSLLLRLDEGVPPCAQDLGAVGRAGEQGGERGGVLVAHAHRVRPDVSLLEGHPHGAHLGGRHGVAVHLGEEVVARVPGLVAPAAGLERAGVRRAVHLLDLPIQPVRGLVVDRVRVGWEEVGATAVLVLVDEQLRRVLPQQPEPTRDLRLRADQPVAVHVERVAVVAPVVGTAVGVLHRDQADDGVVEDRARHAVRAVGQLVQEPDDGVTTGRLVAVDVGSDPQDRRRTTNDRRRLSIRRRRVAEPVEVATDLRQPVQRARVADERVPQWPALPGVRVDPGHHATAGTVGDPPVVADLLVGRLALAELEAEHLVGARHGAAEMRLGGDRVAAVPGRERPARWTRRRHLGQAQSNDTGSSQSGEEAAHVRSVGGFPPGGQHVVPPYRREPS